ncbi:MAG TPA: T9SS type A sorting domain-containing protein [Bacteroidales bacterium]|nr:T9SS type A sorting domain-containing protein [Bacteroidales bacterium]
MKQIYFLIAAILILASAANKQAVGQPPGSSEPLVISSDTWFTGEIFACNDIIVEPGVTLTLLSGCVLHMPADHKMVVQRQAKLFVLGATITDSGDGYWEGIEVWGNNNASSLFFQGYVSLRYGGTVSNAKCAVKATRIRENSDDTMWEYSGGYVRVDDGNLINNTVAAWFYPYSAGSSFSEFLNCNVTISDGYGGAQPPDALFKMQLINGIGFTNVTIADNRMAAPMVLTGIEATGSRFLVNGTNNAGVYTTTFSNLLYGIKVLGTQPLNKVTVDECGFYNNVRGVYSSGTTGDKIVLCHFEPWQNASPFYENYGVYLDQCTGYQVEENSFINPQPSVRRGNGIVINRSGSNPNEIYRNILVGLDYGIVAQNENRSRSGLTGLCIKCNDFDVCNNDIVITIPTGLETPEQGIAAHQGAGTEDPKDMAGNLFYIESPRPDGDFDDINNQANHIIYYVPNNALPSNPRLIPVDYTRHSVTVVDVLNDWTFELGCPSHLVGGGGNNNTEALLATINEAASNADSLQSILDALTDAGNTPQLEAEVFGSTPPETMELYSLLMNTSPWLSDTVVSAAINKEEVLPGALMRDIMVANPHSAKSEYLLQQLADRWEPLPDYMIAQILQGRSLVSLREETGAKLAAWQLKKSSAFSALAASFLADTLDAAAALTDLYILLESDDALHSKYLLAFLKLQHNATQAGAAVLSGIPASFDLTAAQQQAHEQLAAYYQLQAELQADTLHVLQPDNLALAQLSGMVAAGNGLSAVFSRNVLRALAMTEYLEPVILPDMYKAAEAADTYNKLLEAKPPQYLMVKPNPAKDYVILSYQMENEGMAGIEVRSQQGHLVYAGQTGNMQDELTLDTRGWKPGLYVVSLMRNGKLIESTKFTLAR